MHKQLEVAYLGRVQQLWSNLQTVLLKVKDVLETQPVVIKPATYYVLNHLDRPKCANIVLMQPQRKQKPKLKPARSIVTELIHAKIP